MLEAARAADARRFVFASTGGAIYGETDVIPTPEDAEINSEAPYGHAKYSAEGYGDLWRRLHGLSTVSLRFGNVYGPRQDPLGEAGVVAIFCGKLRRRRSADRLRRRPPDARLYICGGSRPRGADRRPAARSTALQRRHRQRVLRARSRRDAGKLGREMGMIGPDAAFERAVRARARRRGAALVARHHEVARRARLRGEGRARGRPAEHARVGRRGRRAARAGARAS